MQVFANQKRKQVSQGRSTAVMHSRSIRDLLAVMLAASHCRVDLARNLEFALSTVSISLSRVIDNDS